MSLRKHAIQLISIYVFYAIIAAVVLHFWPGSAGLWAVTVLAVAAAGLAWHFNTKLVVPNAIETPGVSSPQLQVGWGLGGIAIVLAVELVGGWLSRVLFLQPVSAPLGTWQAAISTAPVYAVAVIVAVPLLEELVFRRVLFGNLAAYTGVFGAAVVAGIVYGFTTDPAHWLTASLVGITYAYLYRTTGSVNTPLIAHIGTLALSLGYAFTH